MQSYEEDKVCPKCNGHQYIEDDLCYYCVESNSSSYSFLTERNENDIQNSDKVWLSNT